jgi:hypothetical protein
MRWTVPFILAIVAGGCLAGPAGGRGSPLYPVGPSRPAPADVATLDYRRPSGSAPVVGSPSFIRTVDGRDVSTMTAPFELLPGCHVVETAGREVTAAKAGGYTGDLGPHVFPFRMRADHEYTVVEEAEPVNGFATVSVHAIERDLAGKQQTHEIPASTGDADVRACRAWSPPCRTCSIADQ